MVTQQRREAPHFGPTWPEVAGFGAAGPNKQFLGFDRREKTENVQVSRHLPCLPFSDKPENTQKRRLRLLRFPPFLWLFSLCLWQLS